MRRIPNVRRWWYFTFDYVPFEKKSSLKEAVASPLDTLFGRYFSSSSPSLLPQSPHSSLHQKPEVMNLAPTREWFTKESFFLIQCALFSCKIVCFEITLPLKKTLRKSKTYLSPYLVPQKKFWFRWTLRSFHKKWYVFTKH